MQESPVQPFDDPALKAALRRSLGQETASAALRDRIKKLASENGPVPENKPIPMFRRSPLYRLAVAAILIIGFGGLAYQIWNSNQPYDPNGAFPPGLYQAMVDTHNQRKAATGGDTVTTLASASSLGSQIKRSVFIADLSKDGWAFQGGAVRQVGSDQAAQLFFTKGKSTISVFSLPASAAPKAKEDESYETTVNGAMIAGFIKSKGLFCIVGTSEDNSLSLDDVKGMLDRHKGEIVKG